MASKAFACSTAVAAAAAFLSITSSSRAALVITPTLDQAPAGTAGATYTPGFGASSSDLLQGKSPIVTYVAGANAGGNTTTYESSAGVTKWTDGSLTTRYAAAGDDAGNHAPYGTVTGTTGANLNQTIITYDLGGLTSLTSANVYQGWNDSGRDQFTFTLSGSTDNLLFTTIGTFTKGTDNTGAFTTPQTTRIAFTDNGGASIAANLRYLRMIVTDADNGVAGMVEFDAFGTAVPEPTSLGVLGMGGLLALRRRRR